jgi:hypothetical protein
VIGRVAATGLESAVLPAAETVLASGTAPVAAIGLVSGIDRDPATGLD